MVEAWNEEKVLKYLSFHFDLSFGYHFDNLLSLDERLGIFPVSSEAVAFST